jgi:hypothetical protein
VDAEEAQHILQGGFWLPSPDVSNDPDATAAAAAAGKHTAGATAGRSIYAMRQAVQQHLQQWARDADSMVTRLRRRQPWCSTRALSSLGRSASVNVGGSGGAAVRTPGAVLHALICRLAAMALCCGDADGSMGDDDGIGDCKV